jgi:hypothetical protein
VGAFWGFSTHAIEYTRWFPNEQHSCCAAFFQAFNFSHRNRMKATEGACIVVERQAPLRFRWGNYCSPAHWIALRLT